MAPKLKDFPTDFVFKAGNQRRSGNHHCYAKGNSGDGDPDNQSGKTFFSGKSESAGDKKRKIHSCGG
jgi:hypothetical protein